jgi:PAS domain S-box-containing protein
LIAITVIGLALSGLAFWLARQADDRRVQSYLELRAQWRAQDFQAKLLAAAAPLEAIATYVNTNDNFTPEQFLRLAAGTRDNGDTTRVFAWAPLITAANRAAFERAADADGLGALSFVERHSDGSVVPVGEREYYVPIWLEQHGPTGVGALRGLDLAAGDRRRQAIEQSIQTGLPVGVAPVKSLAAPNRGPRYTVIWPIFASGKAPATPAERKEQIRGFVLSASDFETLLASAIKDTPKIIEDIVIYIDGQPDGSDKPAALYLSDTDTFKVTDLDNFNKNAKTDDIVLTRQFAVLGRQWTLDFQFKPGTVNQLRSQAPWLWLSAGLLLTFMAANYAGRERMKRVRVEEVAQQRTEELTASNESLNKEVAERERAEIALLHHSNLLGKTLEASPLAIVHLGPNREVLVWNHGAENMFGYTSDEVIGRQYPLIREDDEDNFQELLDRLVSGETVRDRPVDRRHKDGRIVKVNTSAEAVYENGVFQGVVIVLEDLTQRFALEAQLRQAQKMEAIGQLTGGLAHDFNNLLLVILGNLGLLTEIRADDAEVEEICREARDAALRGAELIRSLLAFARRQPLRPEPIDVNALINSHFKLLQRTLGEHIEVAVDLAPRVWTVMVDVAQLEAALINLATNARDAMPKGGHLKIATLNRRLDKDYAAEHPEVAPGDHAMIEVSDNGEGMPADVLNHIFEPFFTTKERGEGTGLGLSMVFGFMKQSGGHISVYSEVGVGTTFRLFLPRAKEPTASDEVTATPLIPIGRGEAILLVEDNDSIRRLAVRQLTQLGYRVHDVSNVADAVDYLESGRLVDLLFTDVVMPGGADGLDLVRIVRARWPTIKILLSSGFPSTDTVSEDFSSLGARLLNKPYQRDELALRVREALDEADPS